MTKPFRDFFARPAVDSLLDSAPDEGARDTEKNVLAKASLPVVSVGALPVSMQDDVRFLSTLCTRLWRFERQLVRLSESDPSDNHDRLLRRFESITEALRDAHIEIIDHDDEKYDSGLNLSVVQWEPREELSREMILETVKPSLRIRQLLIPGEVIVGQPIVTEEKAVSPEAVSPEAVSPEVVSPEVKEISSDTEEIEPEGKSVSPEADLPHLEATETDVKEKV